MSENCSRLTLRLFICGLFVLLSWTNIGCTDAFHLNTLPIGTTLHTRSSPTNGRQKQSRVERGPAQLKQHQNVLQQLRTTAVVAASVSSGSRSSGSRSSDLAFELITGDIPWNTLAGQADRALRLGIQLERSGNSRSAAAAYHEAATLYSCFLESRDEFRHVTSIIEDASTDTSEDNRDSSSLNSKENEEDAKETIATILAYICCRLAHLNLDALGDAKAAVRLYEQSTHIDPHPSAISYDGLGRALEAAGGGRNLQRALEAYTKCKELNPKSKRVLFRIAVVLDRMGEEEQANELLDIIRRSEFNIACLNDSWGYVRWHTRKVPSDELNVYLGTRDMLKLALDAAMPLINQGGLVCEFGVGSGRSLRMTQEVLPLNINIHGFDTFLGLPQAWGNEPKGAYSTGGIIPKIGAGNVIFHQGLFGDTIGPFLNENCDDGAFLAYANIDCDLYTSTIDILEGMHGRIVPGTILVFDEYICHPTWRQDEFRAWRECCQRFGWKYEYLAFSLDTKQAIVKVLDA